MPIFLAEAAASSGNDSDAFVGFLIVGLICWVCYMAGKGKKPKGVTFRGTIQPHK